MRTINTVAAASLVLLLAPAARAEKAKKKPAAAQSKVAAVDDEPTSSAAARAALAAPLDEIKIESLRTHGTDTPKPIVINHETPTPETVGVQMAPMPDAVAHQVKAPPTDQISGPATVTNDAVLEQLAARQMRRQRGTLDACAADAQQRNPTANGGVTLRLTVADRKVVNVSVDKDSLHDETFTKCLDTAARSLSFSLKQVSFNWPVSVASTTASR